MHRGIEQGREVSLDRGRAPTPFGRIVVSAALLIIAAMVFAGCAAGGETAAKSDRVEVVDIDEVPFVRATVEEYSEGLPVVSYPGGEYRAKLEYARVFVDDCSAGYPKMLAAGREMLPVGTEIWVVRSQPIDVDSDWISKDEVASLVAAFIIPFSDEAEPPANTITINERLVARTVALPDPYLPITADPSISDSMRDVRRSMSKHDFSYWSQFHDAYLDNWDNRVGAVGRCRAEWEEMEAAAAVARREAEADLRRWRRQMNALRNSSSSSSGRSCDGDGDGICYEQ